MVGVEVEESGFGQRVRPRLHNGVGAGAAPQQHVGVIDRPGLRCRLYVLMLAVTTAVYGRVSDLVGIRLPLLVGLAMMTGGALVAALAPTYGVLFTARLFQGAGAAAIPTLGAAIACFGPIVGGLLADTLGWRAVMALPILGVSVLPFLWRDMSVGGTGDRLDLLGAILVALTAAGLVLLVQSPTTGVLVAVVGGLRSSWGCPQSGCGCAAVPTASCESTWCATGP